MQRHVFSAFNPSLVIEEQWAAVRRPGVQCLAHGHFDLQLMWRAGIEPTPLGLQDDLLTHWATAASNLSDFEQKEDLKKRNFRTNSQSWRAFIYR